MRPTRPSRPPPTPSAPTGPSSSQPSIRTICEVGFNGGHTAVNLLSARPDSTLVAFDLGRHGAVAMGRGFIESRFPGRFELVVGDSKQTVPKYAQDRPDVKCDFIHVDGDKTYEGTALDLALLQQLANPDGHVLIMNDLGCNGAWCHGGTKAWAEAKKAGRVVEKVCYTAHENMR